MTELEELEQRLVERLDWALRAWVLDVLEIESEKLAQSRVGAAFDQARERQAQIEEDEMTEVDNEFFDRLAQLGEID